MSSTTRRTKIICTIGPATSSEHMLRSLVRAGMDCARLNFSHGAPQDHLRVIKALRRIGNATGKQITILQDLPGPKFRVGMIASGSLQLKKGTVVTLTTKNDKYGENLIPIRSRELPHFAPRGGLVFLSDGAIRLRVLSVSETEIRCVCEIGGTLISGKGVNVPELKRGFETFTRRDRRLLSFGLEHGVDLVAVSFVRKASDINSVRRFLRRAGKKIPIVAKIEKREAVDNISEIVQVSDAVMVARGDLGVENPLEQIPELQKRIISCCTAAATPVITATQMLESMISNPSPTRAEVTDVANAIFDGTDAVMLSEETAMGKYPLECVGMLDRIALSAEKRMQETWQDRIPNHIHESINEAIGRAAANIASELGASAVITLLDSMEAVSKISSLRPRAPIIVISEDQNRLRELGIIWGVCPFRVSNLHAGDPTGTAIKRLKQKNLLRHQKGAVLVCLDRSRSIDSNMRMQVLQTS